MIRVDHAGEHGAKRIYDGQLLVLGRSADAPTIRRMAAQEMEHLRVFDRMIAERGVRPTLFSPLWHMAGFAMGAVTALLGPKAAMACTEAVERVIDEHYADQLARLGDAEPVLARTIARFRDDEIEHRDIAVAHGAKDAPAYPALSAAISGATKLAIRLSTKL
jgi:ubiquinone biosynthesis monooxygenase Coq7